MQFLHGTFRPPQGVTPSSDAFRVHRSRVRDQLEIAYLREGVGGYPLLLLHGYPETKRIWWRNVEPLAAAGFEVVVPDLRGFGDSDVCPEDRHDLVEYSLDGHALMKALGHARYAVVGGDVGGVVAVDLALRFPDAVEKLCFFNSIPPMLFERYAEAGLPAGLPDDATGDYRVWQGHRPDELAGWLRTPDQRRRYIAGMYSHRLWGGPNAFSQDEIDFMTEPFGDEARLRASWAVYQLESGLRTPSEMPRLLEPVPTPTLLLYGPEDHVVPEDFVTRCELSFENRIGPVVVPGAGHFLQWERADILNALLIHTFADLRASV